jgi:HD-GYP domain-containing protein (c-di-GMP phosphodiesterase class II)
VFSLKSIWSSLLEKTLFFRWLLLIMIPSYLYCEHYLPQSEITFLCYLLTIAIGALAFRKMVIHLLYSGLLSGYGELNHEKFNLHMFLFHWFTAFIICTVLVLVIEKYFNEKRNNIDLITTLAKSLDSRDHYTAFHSQNVAYYSKKIAEEMKLPKSVCENIYYGGLLHDIGKIGVPETILNKPSRLTDEEFKHIKAHPEAGFQLVKHIKRFEQSGILHMILYHHERYDGKGYPHGLKRMEIPLEARIMAVADSFDAMTSRRVYRKHLVKLEDAVEEIRKNKGTQFDPEVVTAFLQSVKKQGFDLKNDQEEKPNNHIAESVVL